jgi:glycerol-3-phosphate acyltransferase PlsY
MRTRSRLLAYRGLVSYRAVMWAQGTKSRVERDRTPACVNGPLIVTRFCVFLQPSISLSVMVGNILLILVGYLFGSISSAVLVCRLMGLPDPRTQGSGNPGATNVLRLGGKKAAAMTLGGDLLKGLLPVLLARLLVMADFVVALVGLAAFLGHLYPLFFGFKGGKGVATAFGVLLGLSWPVALAALATWLGIALVFKISSLAALTAAVLAPAYLWWFTAPLMYVAVGALMAGLLVWRHRSNIKNLLSGTEDKIGGPPASP